MTTDHRPAWPYKVTDPDDYRPWMDGAMFTTDYGGNVTPRWTTCGACGRTWNDAMVTGRTPAPASRCPFEDEHQDDAEPTTTDRLEIADLELAARLAQRADAAAAGTWDYETSRLWRIAARAADLATRPDALIVEHLDALAQSALALAVDAEHRSRKQ